ncbi:hypothetical protein BDF20DRAFT_915242 [Mycotypha africana]|uniref:uncharacterized protein n=1 Tax=Mycotypha africana TaxID=64632 RepID=UPI002300E940|nr:uncharacterized protein BDF20DRAFT_915242 [Mycotypha africana]KAI8971413.1 hypothetical protein BDF20DRAFT_915242 [Mycotypha africana]
MAFKIKLNAKKSKRSYEDEQVKQLTTLFPNGDPDYFRSCLSYYNDNAVERIVDKITTRYGGHYPQLPSTTNEQLDDNRLNACLRILALDLFPDCDIAFLREKVLSYSYAHIEKVTKALLSQKHYPERLDYGRMNPADGIRSERYKKQAFLLLTQNYPQAWKSSIKAILAENNYDYLKSFVQLKEMGSGGFWYTLKNFFMHWSANSSTSPNLSTSSHSINHESNSLSMSNSSDQYLLEQIKELHQQDIDRQLKKDLHLAQQLNYKEYDKHKELLTCDCCYLDDFTFEQLLFCTEGAHSFCHDCIQRYMSEGLFGQGNLRGKAIIACIASTDQCRGCLSMQDLEHILPTDMMKAYDMSLLENIMIPSEHRYLKKIQCCSCSYFEVDETMMTPLEAIPFYSNNNHIKWAAACLFGLFLIMFAVLDYFNKDSNQKYNVFWLTLLLASPFLFRLFLAMQQWDIKSDLEVAYHRIMNERRGTTQFKCKNEACQTITCLNCNRPVKGIHKCFAKDTDGLRLYVEKAMADAVKRTIVCRCGYTMCYVCRKDIKRESYAHFCDHFRETPGVKCNKCNKCDLYKTDPEDKLVKQAAARAKKQYLQAHPELDIGGRNGASTNDSLPHIVIGPKTTADRLDEWRRICVMWCLEKVIEFCV